MSALQNVKRIQVMRSGSDSWILLDSNDEPIEAFEIFCAKNQSYAFATQKRYAEVVSHFIDYLIEAGVFRVSTTKRRLNAVLDAYPALLAAGSDATIRQIQNSKRDASDETWLLSTARRLRLDPIAPASFSNTLAGINRFLKLSEMLAVEAFERAQQLGFDTGDDPRRLIQALQGTQILDGFEVRRLTQNSVLGSVIRFCPRGLSRPSRLTTRPHSRVTDPDDLAFPLAAIPHLIKRATSWRDQALWLLLAASGIRISEALNMSWADIDVEERTVTVRDPRESGATEAVPRTRFKGRTTPMTYLFEPLRTWFFQALLMYLKHEFVPYPDGQPNLIFQYVEPAKRGKPFLGVSDAALSQGFKRAVLLAAEDCADLRGRDWTPHSLRHAYGTYMLNDFPVDPDKGQFGLDLSEVQILLGHRDDRSTKRYAKRRKALLQKKLEAADRQLIGAEALSNLPSPWP